MDPLIPPSKESTNTGIEAEILSEQAAALGRAGRRLEAALTHLQTAAVPSDEQKEEAAEALWYYIIQLETMGLRFSINKIGDLEIPAFLFGQVGPRSVGTKNSGKKQNSSPKEV